MKSSKTLREYTHTHTHVYITENNSKNNTREIWVDYTKIFACILVVVGHLLQGLKKADIRWNDNLYYYINEFIYLFHMPLFMCLSGYLYGKYTKIKDKNDYSKFIKKKIINLGIPYLIFYISYVLINMMFSSSVNSKKGLQDIFNIFTNPISPFWFLYALVVIFILIPIIEKLLNYKEKSIFCLLIILFISSLFFRTKVYAIDIFLRYAVYFYFGVLIIKLKNLRQLNLKSTLINAILFTILAISCCIIGKQKIININIISFIKFILALYGVVVSINIFNKLEKNKYFDVMAKYTFPIYLMHTTFSAGIRIALLKIGIYNFYIHFILGLTLGITMPIIEKIKYGNIILYPINTIKSRSKIKDENSDDRT